MKQALWQLLSDFLSAFLFVAVYALSRNLFAAAAIAVAASVGRVVFYASRGARSTRCNG
jgi:intracellular septation protein A